MLCYPRRKYKLKPLSLTLPLFYLFFTCRSHKSSLGKLLGCHFHILRCYPTSSRSAGVSSTDKPSSAANHSYLYSHAYFMLLFVPPPLLYCYWKGMRYYFWWCSATPSCIEECRLSKLVAIEGGERSWVAPRIVLGLLHCHLGVEDEVSKVTWVSIGRDFENRA